MCHQRARTLTPAPENPSTTESAVPSCPGARRTTYERFGGAEWWETKAANREASFSAKAPSER